MRTQQPNWRTPSKLSTLIALSLAASVWGCALSGKGRYYHVEIPELEVAPAQGTCLVSDDPLGPREKVECITILKSDYDKLVTELVAACKALGQKDCGD